MSEPHELSTPSRREFLRLAAAAGMAGALAPVAALAQSPVPAAADSTKVPPAAAPAAGTTAAPPAPPAVETPSDAARALVAALQQRIGKDKLTPEQWESVARDFDSDIAVGKRLAGNKLANGDEPDFAFRVTP
jgi:hypothetical protein